MKDIVHVSLVCLFRHERHKFSLNLHFSGGNDNGFSMQMRTQKYWDEKVAIILAVYEESPLSNIVQNSVMLPGLTLETLAGYEAMNTYSISFQTPTYFTSLYSLKRCSIESKVNDVQSAVKSLAAKRCCYDSASISKCSNFLTSWRELQQIYLWST